MVKVSIIVPVYNVEAYLDKCLNSLVHQTLKEIEIVVVNDGSKDDSYKIIKKYKEKYSDKIVYIEKPNGGVSDARNVGLSYASGEYIGYADSDDYADVTMFEKMYVKAKEDCLDMIACDYYYVYGKKLIFQSACMREFNDIKMAIRGRVIWNKIIRREILKDNKTTFPLGMHPYEDVAFFYKVTPHIRTIGLVKEPLYYYVHRESSITNTPNERAITDVFRAWDDIIEYYREHSLFEEHEIQLEYNCIRSFLNGSFFKMVKIKDRRLRKRLLRENWQKLSDLFPNWRKNPFLQTGHSLASIYLRSQNRFTYPIYSKLLSIWYNL